jgi:peroxiredoxin Q/BCP
VSSLRRVENDQRLVGAAIDGVRAQTLTDFEPLILDNALPRRISDRTIHGDGNAAGRFNTYGFTQERSRMPLIEPGKKAPAFTLKDQDGKTRRLADYAGKPLILYFYPKDDTPGCTTESCAFQAHLPAFKKDKTAVLGISILDEASKARFAAKHGLTFPLLADADHAVAEKYGVWQKKSLYGRQFMGIARTTYLIGGDGKVVKRWDNVKVNGHAEAVLEAASA